MPNSFISIFLSFFCVYIVYKWNKSKSKYRKLPQPPALPIIGHAFEFLGNPFYPDGKKIHQRSYQQILKITNQYTKEGIACWFIFNKPLIMIFKPEYVEKILTSTIEIQKGLDYRFLKPWLSKGLLLNTGSLWKARRRIISPAFHFTILNDFIPTFVECAQNLCNHLKEEQKQNGQIENLMKLVERTTLEVICKTSIGISLESIENGNESYLAFDYSQTLATVINIAFERTFKIIWESDLIFYLSKTGQKFKSEVKKLTSFMDQVIDGRIKQLSQKRAKESNNLTVLQRQERENIYFGKEKRKMAFLDLLIETYLDQEQECHLSPLERTLDIEGIRDEVNTFTFAGFDTSSSTLLSILYLIGLHPEVQQKAYEEILEVTSNIDDELYIHSENLNQLKYLDACIKETLRFFSIVPLISRHLISDVILDKEIIIPAGSDISISIMSLHKSELHYKNPELFRPERFFDKELHKSNKSPFSFIPFSAGPRNCIGQRFALIEIKTILVILLREFRFESIIPLKDFKFKYEIILKPNDKVPIQVHSRK